MNVKKYFWLVAGLFLINVGCMEKMNHNPVAITRMLADSTLPSGSGLAVSEGAVYVVGDDSPWLFKYSKDLTPLGKFLLAEGFVLEGRIPKMLKPDFECMAQIQEGGNTSLLIFGSGSKSPERDLLVKVNLQQPENPVHYSLTPFYNHLTSLSGATRAELNMEAAMVSGEELFLFNRADNRIYVTDWRALLEALPHEEAIRKLEIRQYQTELPELQGVKAGFSGACPLPGQNKILFTATLEDTEDWIADGEVLGSYLGVLDLSSPEEVRLLNIALVLDESGKPIRDKLESVDLLSISQTGEPKLMAVADNDDGTSLLLELSMKASFLNRAD